MGRRYTATARVGSGSSSGAVYAAMMAGATAAMSLKKVRATTHVGAGAEIGIARAAAVGTAASTGVVTGLAHRANNPAPGGRLEIAWSQAPTGPTGTAAFFARDILQGVTGAARTLWDATVDGPLEVEPSAALVFLNTASGTSAEFDLEVTWEEGARGDI